MKVIKPKRAEVDAFWALRARRIPTKSLLGKLPADTVFVAIDVKPNASRHSPTKISLAVLPKLGQLAQTLYGKQSLGDFVRDHEVEVFSFKLESVARDLRRRSESRMRRAFFFRPVKTRHIEVALSHIIDGLRNQFPNQKLVIVGYSLQGELGPIGLNVLDVLRRFDNWVDLCGLGGYIPKSLVNPFDILRDESGDSGLRKEQKKAERAIKHLYLQAIIYAAHPFALPPSIDSARKIAKVFDKYDPIAVAADEVRMMSKDSQASKGSRAPKDCPASKDVPAPKYSPAAKNSPAPKKSPAPKDSQASKGSQAPKKSKASNDSPAVKNRPAPKKSPASKNSQASTPTIDTPFMNRGCLCFETPKMLQKFINATKDLEIDGFKIHVLQVPLPRKRPEEEKWEDDFGGPDMTLDFKRSYLCKYRDLIRWFDRVGWY
ncbi:hypothetical protein F5Y06DRAFT_270696 [Hypoxylon sp. FL0890]|nr:hypothetical protein F5Y06DRAFT_270696 [Hypoxylon sp. FL0890]